MRPGAFAGERAVRLPAVALTTPEEHERLRERVNEAERRLRRDQFWEAVHKSKPSHRPE